MGSEVRGRQAGQVNLHQQHAALEQCGLRGNRHAEGHDLARDALGEMEQVPGAHMMLVMDKQHPDERQRRADAARHNIGITRAVDAHLHDVDKREAAHQMHDVDDDGEEQARARIAQASESVEDRVKYCIRDKRNRDQAHVADGVLNQQRFRRGVERIDQYPGKDQKTASEHQRRRAAQGNRTADGVADAMVIAMALGTRDDDRAADGKGVKDDRHD